METGLVVLIVTLITAPVVVAGILVLRSSIRNSRSKEILSTERSVSTEVGVSEEVSSESSTRLRDLVIENMRKKRRTSSREGKLPFVQDDAV